MNMEVKIKETGYYYIFERDKNNALDFINNIKIKYETQKLLYYVKKKADTYFREHLLLYCKKYAYQRIKISLISTSIIKNKEISRFFIRIMIGKLKNIPNAYICGNDRFFEIVLTQKEGKFDYKENISLIDNYFTNFVNKKINFKLLVSRKYINQKNISSLNSKRSKKIISKEWFSNCSGLTIKNHYSNFKLILNRLTQNGLLNENEEYLIRCFYYQSINESEKWELSVSINESERWSSMYSVDDIRSVYEALIDCKMIDRILKDYDVFEMSENDLRELVNYSKTILY